MSLPPLISIKESCRALSPFSRQGLFAFASCSDVPNEVWSEILDGLEEGYEFYSEEERNLRFGLAPAFESRPTQIEAVNCVPLTEPRIADVLSA